MILSLNKMWVNSLVEFARYGIYALIIALTIAGLFKYTGNSYIYLIFSVVSNALLYIGFRNNAIFFDAFIGVFFWLGFWLKLTVRVIFFEGLFHESVGNFDGSGTAFDYALLVATCGLFGLLVASVVREKFIFTYPKISNGFNQCGILNFYKNYRQFILTGFMILILIIALTNIYFGIYQKGEISQTVLPFGLNGIYKWLLLFGLASVSAVLLHYESLLKKELSYLLICISLLEVFLTNVSLLSRGMILNVSALAYGIYASLKYDLIKIKLSVIVVSFIIFSILFVFSVIIVNSIRSEAIVGMENSNFAKAITQTVTQTSMQTIKQVSTQTGTKALFLDRWVGIEGVMAVSSSPKMGWGLWSEAWKEKYSDNVISFYDKNLISSPYDQLDFTKKHNISLPGIIAFCFYPGSYLLLFGCIFLMGLFAALIEVLVFKLGGRNLILCSLMAEVVAYRFASFGYVPAQSYLLFGTISLNVMIIYFFAKVIGIWNEK